MSGVRTPTPAYNNALSYQLSYAHGTISPNLLQAITLSHYIKAAIAVMLLSIYLLIKEI